MQESLTRPPYSSRLSGKRINPMVWTNSPRSSFSTASHSFPQKEFPLSLSVRRACLLLSCSSKDEKHSFRSCTKGRSLTPTESRQIEENFFFYERTLSHCFIWAPVSEVFQNLSFLRLRYDLSSLMKLIVRSLLSPLSSKGHLSLLLLIQFSHNSIRKDPSSTTSLTKTAYSLHETPSSRISQPCLRSIPF